MLHYYAIQNASLYTVSDQELKDGTIEPIWIDVIDPSEEEGKLIASIFNILITNNNKAQEIKLPSCYYQQKNEVVVTINAPLGEYKTQPVNIILTQDKIITTQSAGTPESKEYISYILQQNPEIITPNSIFAYFIESRLNSISADFEQTSHYLDYLSEAIFVSEKFSETKKLDLDKTINQLGKKGHMLAKHHESLISMRRALTFISNSKQMKSLPSEIEKFNDLIYEASLLEERLSFLSSQIEFLLEIVFGMINTEQSSISKVLSIAALIFLPPSIVASILASSFDYVPLVQWTNGFWISFILIIVSAWLPYFLCKLKRWI